MVDNWVAVIVSVNINDWSFVGYSDSDIGAIFWYDVDGSIRDFRICLWSQFLGLPLYGSTNDLVVEPGSNTEFDVWTDTACKNLNLLYSVKNFTPRNSIASYSEYQQLK